MRILASLAAPPVLLPATGLPRFRVLRLQALADGIMDSAVERYAERNFRPAERQLPEWMDRLRSAATRALDYLETTVDQELRALDLGTIAVTAALGYLDHRFPEDEWRRGRPRLSAWFAAMAARDSFTATAPQSH